MGAVVHAHQRLLVIDAGEHQDHRRVGHDQVQVVLGEVKVDDLKSGIQESSSDEFPHHLFDHLTRPQCHGDHSQSWNISCHSFMGYLSIKSTVKIVLLKCFLTI